MDRHAILSRLEELNALPEVRTGFRTQDACLAWVNEVAALLRFRTLYHNIAVQEAHLLSRRSLSADLLTEAMRTIRSQVEQAIAELKSDLEEEDRNRPIPHPPNDTPTPIGGVRMDRLGRGLLARCPPWVPDHWRWRLDRLLTRRQWLRLNRFMELEEFRNEDHLEANAELHHRYNYLTDQLREHEDERLLERNMRRSVAVPTHASRDDGPNEHWNISSFTGQWLLTHNGRVFAKKAYRDHWFAILKRWKVILGIIAALLSITTALWPVFRSSLFSFLKDHVLSRFVHGP